MPGFRSPQCHRTMHWALVIMACAVLPLGCDRFVAQAEQTVTLPQDSAVSIASLPTANARGFGAALDTIEDDLAAAADATSADEAILIGLDADMSAGSAQAGEAIRRGILLAIDEINRSGGVLGRPVQLVVRDHRGNPARGIDHIVEFATMPNLVAVVGGIHTPVALEELKVIHQHQVIYLGPWAAGTNVVSNGYDPNYVFRVSVRDEFAGEFLVQAALERKLEKLGLLLERTGWGRSNELAMTRALGARGSRPVAIRWFHWSEPSVTKQLRELAGAGAEAVLLVANPPEGATTVRDMASLPREFQRPIISHWGITGGRFPELAGESLRQVDLVVLQTYSFLQPELSIASRQVADAYCRRFDDATTARDIFSPVGTAHAYDLVRMLRMAIQQAGSIDRPAVRDALESIESFDGLIRHYRPPFTSDRHDALTIENFHLCRFDDEGRIVPLAKSPHFDTPQPSSQTLEDSSE